ncbi:ankyrin repeat domain-containing protein [Aspergillus mulundensis]|uniref:Uncharacterized protein n=1 Tax=Aspergillus mulundensis TaxID=1810919 RepID=A0A3D8R0E0_9EURO|nr:hypothetical protein DSM5745_09284 [Aspergillus mulundensis]RDW67418.1 hypothetical protein DSM5745_09284 [Aspergillus mulundensis]
MSTSLPTLPPELHLLIWDSLPTRSDKANLARTNRPLYTLLIPRLYKEALASWSQHRSLTSWRLEALAQGNNLAAMTRFLNAGAPVSTVHESRTTGTYVSCAVLDGAVRKGSPDMVRLLLEHNVDPNAADYCGCAVLGRAVQKQDLAKVRLLLDAGAHADGFTRAEDAEGIDPVGEDREKERVLIRALARVRPRGKADMATAMTTAREIVGALLDRGADPACVGRDGLSALCWAARGGDAGIVQRILGLVSRKKGFDISAGAPLVWAVKSGSVDAVRVLLGHEHADGSEMETQALESGDTVLTSAVALGDLAMLFFVTAYLPLTLETVAAQFRHNDRRSDLLTIAVRSRSPDMVRAILNANAGLNGQDEYGRTALWHAVRKGTEEVVRVLLDAGAEVNIPDKEGETPLHRAFQIPRRSKRTSIITMLLDAGACPRTPDPLIDLAPLLCAAAGGATAVVRKLLALGVERDCKGKHGETPLCVAAMCGRPEVVLEMLSDGTAPETWRRGGRGLQGAYATYLDQPDSSGRTPLHHAAMHGFVDIVRILLVRGSDAMDRASCSGTTPKGFCDGVRYAALDNDDGTMQEIYEFLCDPGTATIDADVLRNAAGRCRRYRRWDQCYECDCVLSGFGGWYINPGSGRTGYRCSECQFSVGSDGEEVTYADLHPSYTSPSASEEEEEE